MNQIRSINTSFLEYASLGDPTNVLQFKTSTIDQSLNSNQILLKNLASPINPADINMIQGNYGKKVPLPCIGGSEFVAQVIETGTSVVDLKPDDWVIAVRQGLGTWRDFLVLNYDDVIKIPNDLPMLSAATIYVNPATALRMLEDFVELQPGHVVIQNGSNSTVGQGVIQLCKLKGVKTVNIVRDRSNLEQLKQYLCSLGADHVITEKQLLDRGFLAQLWSQLGTKPVLALNCVGGRQTSILAGCLKEKGKLVSYGNMSKQPLEVPVGPLIFNDIQLNGFWISKWSSDPANYQKRLETLNYLAELIKSGHYKTPECETIKLQDYRQAFERLANGFTKKQVFVFK